MNKIAFFAAIIFSSMHAVLLLDSEGGNTYAAPDIIELINDTTEVVDVYHNRNGYRLLKNQMAILLVNADSEDHGFCITKRWLGDDFIIDEPIFYPPYPEEYYDGAAGRFQELSGIIKMKFSLKKHQWSIAR